MTCPKCGSEKISAVSETETSNKGFDCCLGILGAILFGWVGWLCGLCGMGEGTTKSKIIYVCSNCGQKYNSTKELDPWMKKVN